MRVCVSWDAMVRAPEITRSRPHTKCCGYSHGRVVKAILSRIRRRTIIQSTFSSAERAPPINATPSATKRGNLNRIGERPVGRARGRTHPGRGPAAQLLLACLPRLRKLDEPIELGEGRTRGPARGPRQRAHAHAGAGSEIVDKPARSTNGVPGQAGPRKGWLTPKNSGSSSMGAARREPKWTRIALRKSTCSLVQRQKDAEVCMCYG